MKTILIEKTAKRLKLYELIITTLLFITLLTGFVDGFFRRTASTWERKYSVPSAVKHSSGSTL